MSHTVKIHELDPSFKEELAREPGCQHLLRCFSCGVCTAACPVSDIEPEFSPSRIIRQIIYGQRRELLSSPALWYCARCAQCSFQCPQDVRFLDVIQGLRTLAVREALVDAAQVALLEQGERTLRELRRRLIAAILANTGDPPELRSLLAELVARVEVE